MDRFSYHHLRMLAIGILISFTFFFSFGLQASEESVVVSKQELAIEKMDNELQELVDALYMASGEERDALQLKLFQKNEELRAQLASAVSRGNIAKDSLIALIEVQENYAINATSYLEERIKSLNGKLDSASNEQRLTLLNEYQELQHYLDGMIKSRWQNIEWLKSLAVEQTTQEAKYREAILKRLSILSASVEYFNQQISVVGKQLDVSPESEKAAIELSQLVIRQRLNITIDSLTSMMSIADRLGVDTSEYKRLLFEITGSITHELFEGKVIFAILTHWLDSFWNWVVNNAPEHLFQLFIFALIILATKVFARLVRKIISKAVSSKNLKLSQLMQDFFIGMSGNIVWVIGILVGLSQVGLNLAPVLTGFGIAGVIIGFALQDTLSNFAAGMMLLIYRPFDVRDLVSAGGVDGQVSHMSLVNTTIKTFDNQIIIIPNSKIWGDVIKNVTHERVRRVDMVFGIGYRDDLLKAESILTDIVTEHPAVLRTPEPNIRVHTLNTSSVDFIVRPWVKTDDYWDVYWDVTKEVKLRFDREGISIPFPQQDVHLHTVKEEKE